MILECDLSMADGGFAFSTSREGAFRRPNSIILTQDKTEEENLRSVGGGGFPVIRSPCGPPASQSVSVPNEGGRERDERRMAGEKKQKGIDERGRQTASASASPISD